MTEKKYEDFKGFEDKDTFVQFDEEELINLYGGKNRYIYDFSSTGDTPGTRINPSYNYNPYALAIRSAGYEYGLPGDFADVISPVEPFNRPSDLNVFSNQRSLSLWPNWVPTVNFSDDYEETCPYFDENAFIFTDAKADDSPFGTMERRDTIDFFRSGYVEFSIKTSKENQIIASGSSEAKVDSLVFFGIWGADLSRGASISEFAANEVASSNMAIGYDNSYFKISPYESALINLEIALKDGKLTVNYNDKYNLNNVDFVFQGNEYLADNEWHHVVVNFGRPGLRKGYGQKFNKKFLEIWTDGQLDKRFDDKVNEYQIFYPKVTFLFNSMLTIFENAIEGRKTFNTSDSFTGNQGDQDYIGFSEFIDSDQDFVGAISLPKSKRTAFRGAFHTFAHGVNFPISKFEIQARYALWRNQTKNWVNKATGTSEMVEPLVSTNSKKALKLFWNNLVPVGKHGVELDDNLQVESFSVTHKTTNSRTEIYNKDSLTEKEINIFENVRIALTDHIIIEGPARIQRKNSKLGNQYSGHQQHPNSTVYKDMQNNPASPDSVGSVFIGEKINFTLSGIYLNVEDRILLTNQTNPRENGIWVYKGPDQYLQRAADSFSSEIGMLNVVYVEEGDFAGNYWVLETEKLDAAKKQSWFVSTSQDLETIQLSPRVSTMWKDYRGRERFINVLEDVDINNYDVITFMNYPETNDEIYDNMPNTSQQEVMAIYKEFVNNILTAAANGTSVYVSSPKLASDLGIIRGHSVIDQMFEDAGDQQSALMNPFQFDEPAERYFDTHRNNKYQIVEEVAGLTDKQTWTMTDFINYVPEDQYDEEHWHVKYSYRPTGLKELDEFYIPGIALRHRTDRKDLPGYRNNYRGKDVLLATKDSDVLAGTVVSQLSNTVYVGGQLITNPYDNYATTIIVSGGQQIGGVTINGKIFVNFTEDAYTYSREDYNSAKIQVVPEDDPNESLSSLSWQYSTTRLNRKPQRINISELTFVGQTIPKDGGGGAFLQGASNSSNGIIRSQSDFGKPEYESDLYPSLDEEIYKTQEIKVLSMTWLGLKWLIGE